MTAMAQPKQRTLLSFLVAVRNTYDDMFCSQPSDEAIDIAEEVFNGEDLEDYREDLSAGEYDAIDLNLKY